MVVSVENSGEIGEIESVTIVMHWLHPTLNGDAHEYYMRKAGLIRVYSEPFFSRDCAVEVG